MVSKKEKHKISKTIKNNYSATKNFWKPKHCWHKLSYYRAPKNFTYIIQDYKTGWKGSQIGSNSSLYSDKINENVLKEKM